MAGKHSLTCSTQICFVSQWIHSESVPSEDVSVPEQPVVLGLPSDAVPVCVPAVQVRLGRLHTSHQDPLSSLPHPPAAAAKKRSEGTKRTDRLVSLFMDHLAGVRILDCDRHSNMESPASMLDSPTHPTASASKYCSAARQFAFIESSADDFDYRGEVPGGTCPAGGSLAAVSVAAAMCLR